MSSEIAIVTYLYPSVLMYFQDFLDSIESQTNQNFDLIIFNDGVEALPAISESRTYKVFKTEGTPLENRLESIKILKKLDYRKFIFSDSDDTISINRVDIVSRLLEENEIVVNDLNTMNDSGVFIDKNIWEERADELNKINIENLKNYNFIGLGNTAVRSNLLKKYTLKESEIPMVADWFIFYQYLFFVKKTKVAFTADCQTNYRQHVLNTAGIRELSDERFEYLAKVKKAQYEALVDIGIKELVPLKNCKFVINSSLKNKTPFWWEEISYERNAD